MIFSKLFSFVPTTCYHDNHTFHDELVPWIQEAKRQLTVFVSPKLMCFSVSRLGPQAVINFRMFP